MIYLNFNGCSFCFRWISNHFVLLCVPTFFACTIVSLHGVELPSLHVLQIVPGQIKVVIRLTLTTGQVVTTHFAVILALCSPPVLLCPHEVKHELDIDRPAIQTLNERVVGNLEMTFLSLEIQAS